MPDFWQFPTGSMGIGPINAIYQARFMRYLQHRGLLPRRRPTQRRVWGFFGDGEMDEPESIARACRSPRARSSTTCMFVINCNLQRLDGPVRGNGRIIDELETLFAGAGWNVIKLPVGQRLGRAVRARRTGALMRAFAHTVDGQIQTFSAKDGALQPRASSSARTRNSRRSSHDLTRRGHRPPAARRPRPREDPRRLSRRPSRTTASPP